MLSCSRFLKLLSLLGALGLATLGLLASSPVLAQAAVLTQNNDNARTGANTLETALTPTNVNVAGFGKLFTITGLNANVNGQVLYVPGLTIGGSVHNVVYAYTSNNTDNSPCGLYAYDADNGQQLWKTLLPNSATYTTVTPVIDPATNTIYVLTKTGNDDTGATFLHAFDAISGQDKPGSPIQVQASAPGTGDGSVNGRVSFDGPASSGRFHANDRAALLLLNSVVYTSFAHNSDSFPYHGWVLAYKYNGTQFSQTASFCTTPNGSDGGVWQSGKGLTADAAGNIYFSIGNGTFDANSGGQDYGMCYMKMSPALKVLDWFAPFDEQSLSNQDLDLGNTGVSGIPGTTRLFGGATKFGSAFLLDSANLGHFTANGPDKVLDRIDSVSSNDNVGQNPISWDSGSYKYVYLWPSSVPIRQFRYDPIAGNLSPKGIFATGSTSVTSGGSLAISSNGGSNAILWAVGNNGVVHAYDATNVANNEFWNSSQNSSRDALGSVGHFQFPTVVNGKVYVPTGASTIAVYGLQPAASITSMINDTSSDIVYTGGGWFYSSNRGLGDFQADVHATTTNGDSASYTFTGTGVGYVTETYADEGNVQVYLDGTLQTTVNCASTTRKVQQTLWSKTGLSNGTHTLRLVKQDGGYMLLDALSVNATPTAPPAPTGLRAAAGNAQVSLTWTASAGAASYNLYRATTAGAEGTTPYKTGLTATSYTDTALTNNTTYFYKVAALNSTGDQRHFRLRPALRRQPPRRWSTIRTAA